MQRVAVGTAANMCRGLTAEHAEAATAAAPILIQLLQYQVRYRVQYSTVCFVWLSGAG